MIEAPSLMRFAAGTLSFLSPRHYRVLHAVSGTILIGMGALVPSGELFRLNIEAQRLLSELGLDFFYNI